MLFTNRKKTEINKMKSFVFAIAQFCAEMTIQKRIYFSQSQITEIIKKEEEFEIKTFSFEMFFLTLTKEEKQELRMNALKIHPRVYGEMVLKIEKETKFSLEKIEFSITNNLKEKTISSFFFSNDPRFTEEKRYSLWMSEEQKDDFVQFVFDFANFM